MSIWRLYGAIILLSFVLVGCAPQPTVTPVPRLSIPSVGQQGLGSQPVPPSAEATAPPATVPAAEGVARVQFDVDADSAAVGSPVTIRLVGLDVSALFGTQVEIRYDPALAQIEDADPSRPGVQVRTGESLAAAEASFVAVNAVDVDQGTIEYAVTLLSPARPLEGDIEMLSFVLTPTKTGPITLDLTLVLMSDRNANSLPVTFESLTLQAE